jgi:DNA-binding response OmpR family regulator
MARILILNDEADLLKLCQMVLEERGHEVEIMTSGDRAVMRARKWRPDLVVIDWVMPDMEGGAIMSAMRSSAEAADIPILVMSALRDGAARAALYGAQRFLAKPFTAEELVAAVEAGVSGEPTDGTADHRLTETRGSRDGAAARPVGSLATTRAK